MSKVISLTGRIDFPVSLVVLEIRMTTSSKLLIVMVVTILERKKEKGVWIEWRTVNWWGRQRNHEKHKSSGKKLSSLCGLPVQNFRGQQPWKLKPLIEWLGLFCHTSHLSGSNLQTDADHTRAGPLLKRNLALLQFLVSFMRTAVRSQDLAVSWEVPTIVLVTLIEEKRPTNLVWCLMGRICREWYPHHKCFIHIFDHLAKCSG